MKALIVLSVLFCAVYCKNAESYSRKENEIIKEDFEVFYQRFHNDSLFQMSRVIFPLDGYDISEDFNPLEGKEENDFYWQMKDWVLMKPLNLDSDMKKELTNKDSMRIERIYIPDSGFEIIREFKLLNGMWFLVFYGNQNL